MKKNYLLLSLLTVVLFQISATAQETLYQTMAMNVPVPNWQIAECEGTTENLHSYLNAGKVVIVYYADTWCSICKGKAHEGFTSSIIKDYLKKYPNKIQFLAAFDGPTDCNGVKAAKSEYGWGSEIKAFVDNTNDQSKFYSWGAPGFSIISPKTKKVIYATYNNAEVDGGLKALTTFLDGQFVYPDSVNNIVYRKPISMIYQNASENSYQPLKCVNDGIRGSTYNGDAVDNKIGFIIDLKGGATISGFESFFQESNGPSYSVATSDSKNGPWVKVAGNFGNNDPNKKSGLAIKAKFVKWEATDRAWFGEFEVYGKMDNPTANENAAVISNISISPNPSSGIFNLDLPNINPEDTKIIISEPSGKQLKLITPKAGINNMDLTDLQSGIYFAKIYLEGNNTKIIKLVIQK
jgi:hypothetical protein